MPYHLPRIFRPVGTIGECGTNNPDDVKELQRMIVNAGFNELNGNYLKVSGHCDSSTKSAIIWYQRLLSMSPTGLVHPQEIFFFKMFSETIKPHWRPSNIVGTLYVREGQFTFDAEGQDYLTAVEPFKQPQQMPYFSRILHWPGGRSGVTLGRGYDMKMRSSGSILADMRQAGIEEFKALICSKASGLSGRLASNFVKDYGKYVGEINHLQQVKLFENAFSTYVATAKRIYMKSASGELKWQDIDKDIKNVFYDTLYQGNSTARQMVKAVATNDKSEVVKYIRDYNPGSGTSRDALRIRYLTK